MARNRASMREGPLAELFRATEAAQRQQEQQPPESAATETPALPPPEEPQEKTVEHVPDFAEEAPLAAAPAPVPAEPELPPVSPKRKEPAAAAHRHPQPRRRPCASPSTSRPSRV